MNSINITTSQLNSIVATLKKTNRLGSSLLYHNDVMEIIENGSLLGKHYAKNIFDVGDRVYIMRDIKSTINNIEEIKGRKTSINYNVSLERVSIIINNIECVLFELHQGYEIDSYFCFDDLWNDNYKEVSRQSLEELKNNKLVVLEYNNTHARLAKSYFPELSTSRNITHSIQYYMIEKKEEKEKNNPIYYVYIKVTFEKEFPIMHRYGLFKYK